MVTSCADLRIAQQMDPRSMSVDLSREGAEYVPEANLPGIDSESIELGGRPAAVRAVSGPVRDRRREVVHRRTAPTGNSCGCWDWRPASTATASPPAATWASCGW